MASEKGLRVLVTGGCGFIGSHIVDQLILSGHDVIIVDNLVTGNIQNIRGRAVRFYHLDILHPKFEQVVGRFLPDCIIHQAAQASVAYSVKNMILDENVNIQGSLHVLHAALKHHVKKIVYASTAAIYGNPHYVPVDLDHPAEPKSPYGISKYTFEHYLRMAYELHGMEYTILRYANVYGPRQNASGEGGVISIFADRLAKKEPLYVFGDGEQTRDFIYVEDVARANVATLSLGSNRAYHISSGKGTSINQLIRQFDGIVGSKLTPIYLESRPGDIQHSVLCNCEATRGLHWRPQISLAEGLKRTIEFYVQGTEIAPYFT